MSTEELAVVAAPDPSTAKSGWMSLEVVNKQCIASDVHLFELARSGGGALPPAEPGSHITLLTPNGLTRRYSVCNRPDETAVYRIAVKREENGLGGSRSLVDQVQTGDPVSVSPPSNYFPLLPGAPSYWLIAGGIGITPMMCVARCLTDRSFTGDIFFLHGARTVEDFVFREELEYLQKRHRNLHVAATVGSASGPAWHGPVGPVTKEFIAQAVPDIARRRIHVCGPPPMMEAVKASLLQLGVARNKIKTEAFGAAQGRVPTAVEHAPPRALPAEAPEDPLPDGLSPGAAPTTATAQVEFTISGRTAPLAPGQSVLEAAEAVGVVIDYSCRAGTCGVCVVPLKTGTVTMEVEDGLPPEEKAKGMILACQAKSLGNLVVEA